MRQTIMALLVALLIVPPTPAAAAPPTDLPSEPQLTDAASPLVDADGDLISDGLQQQLTELGDATVDVIATFVDEVAAGNSNRSLPPQALRHRFTLIPAFSATLNRGQIEALAHQPGVLRIEENFKVSATIDSANRDFGTEAARADYGVDGTGVGICVVDTGIDSGHEQFDGEGKIAYWADFTIDPPIDSSEPDVSGDPYDDHGHGTHVASIAAGGGTGGSNAATFKGVAPAATLYSAKVLDASGTSVADSVIGGIQWCANQAGVDLISMSLGGGPSDGLDALSLAVNAAVDVGKIVVVAAGNSGDGPSSVETPGAAAQAITVGAVADGSDGIYLAPFSSRGPTLAPTSLVKPDIVAPGVTITAAQAGSPSSYATFSGTSMATPFTSGTIALMLQADASLDAAGVMTILSATAVDRGPTGKDNDWGWGLLDGHAAVGDAAGANIVPTVFPANATLSGTVPDGGNWTHTFTLTEADLGAPIAATILLDGEMVCTLDLGPFGCWAWEWLPDIDAQLRDPSGAVLADSTCPADTNCGTVGHQETLTAMPTTAGTYTIELSPWDTTGGTFTLDLSTGPIEDPPPPAPVGLVAAPGDGVVLLDWADNVEADLASYSVYRSTTSGGPYGAALVSGWVSSDYVDLAVANATTYYYVVTATDAALNESGFSDEKSATPVPPVDERADFDGDGTMDIAVFRPSNGRWYIQGQPSIPYGVSGDIPVPGNWDGLSGAEIGLFRPSNGRWYIQGPGASIRYGVSGDVPVPADYDGDGTTDIAVFRPSNGRWYVRGQGASIRYGVSGDIPVPADYDGDGTTDIAVFRPSNGRWYVRGQGASIPYGVSGDIPVPADYDGDGTTDIAVFRPSNGRWYIRGQAASIRYGVSGDIPVAGNWDGVAGAEIALFRPSNGRWYIRGQGASIPYGVSGDIPLAAAPNILYYTTP